MNSKKALIDINQIFYGFNSYENNICSYFEARFVSVVFDRRGVRAKILIEFVTITFEASLLN